MGWDITVISPKLSDQVKKDKTLFCEELDRINHIVLPYGKIFTRIFYEKRNKFVARGSGKDLFASRNKTFLSKIKSFTMKRARSIYTIVRNASWEKQVVRYLQRHFEKKEFDYVFSSYPSSSSHMAAMFAFEKGIAKKWVADFRDPMSYESLHSKLEKKLYGRIQGEICKKASIVTAVSKELVKKLEAEYHASGKCFYLPNGFDSDDLKNLKEMPSSPSIFSHDGEFTIAYTGSLYGGLRDLGSLFHALKELEQEGSINVEKVRFLYAGRDFETLEKQARKFDMGKILINYGFVARIVSLQLQKTADLTVICTLNTDKEQGVITGKIYESFLLKKPVLVVVNGTKPGGELSEMVQKSRLGFVFNSMLSCPYQHQDLKNYLSSKFKETFCKQSTNFQTNNEYIERFDYANITRKMAEILERQDHDVT